MKTLQLLITFVLYLISYVTVMAQNPVATLESNGTTKVFYGINAFIDSYNASVNGNHIYLSTGYFNPPTSIAKKIRITGAGHFPDSANVAKRTTILGNLAINKGADSLRLEGLYINDVINYDGNNSINAVNVSRCRIYSVMFNSVSANAGKNYCVFNECFISGLNFFMYGTNLELSHCVIDGSINNINNAIFNNNIFLNFFFNTATGSLFKNNIFFQNALPYSSTFNGSSFNNNIFLDSNAPIYSSNINNYLGIPQANIFVNQTGNTINYSHNYHLKTPSSYPGTDGTQVGLYGGTVPFKEKGLPSNPQIISKNVSSQTDANGKIQINFTVKAQSN